MVESKAAARTVLAALDAADAQGYARAVAVRCATACVLPPCVNFTPYGDCGGHPMPFKRKQ